MPPTPTRTTEPVKPSPVVRLRGLVGAVTLSVGLGLLVTLAIGVLLAVTVLFALTVLG